MVLNKSTFATPFFSLSLSASLPISLSFSHQTMNAIYLNHNFMPDGSQLWYCSNKTPLLLIAALCLNHIARHIRNFYLVPQPYHIPFIYTYINLTCQKQQMLRLYLLPSAYSVYGTWISLVFLPTAFTIANPWPLHKSE